MKKLAILLSAAALMAQVRLPDYTREVLPNGAVLDLMPRGGIPLISLRIVVKGGSASDPDGKGGLASVTAELLQRGTAKRTSDRFAEEVEQLGATLDMHVMPDATVISAQFLSKDRARMLDLLSDAVIHPAFPEPEFRKALAEGIEQAKALKDSPQAAAHAYFQSFFFGPRHPYGHRPDGDEVSLARITRDDVVEYHKRQYTGRNVAIIAAGDLEIPSMRADLASAFSPLPGGESYTPRPAAANPDGEARLLLVDKPGSAQTYFWIGNPGISRTDPDRVAVWLVNVIFGGRFTSMLNDELRVNAGLTYGAMSQVDENRLPGRVALFTYTKTEDSGKAIDLALEVLRRLREQGIDAGQLASAKAYLKGAYPSDRLETPGQLAGILGELELFGLNRSEIDGLFARVDGVTVDQANAAAKRHFGSGGLVFTVVGDAGRIRAGLRKYAPAVVETAAAKPGFEAR